MPIYDPDIDPSDLKLANQAAAAAKAQAAAQAAAAAKAQAAQQAATQSALTRLTSGATLTAAEKALLNISPTVTTNPTTTNPTTTNPTTTNPTTSPTTTSTTTDDSADWTTRGNQALYKGSPFSGMRNGIQFINGYRQDMYDENGKERVQDTSKADLAALQAKYDALLNNQKQQQRANVTTALADFTASLASAGMGKLVDTINQWILDDKTAAQIAIDIRGTDVYKQRFPGMEALSKAGKAVTEGTYISMERGMIGILKAYGLDDKVLGTTEKLGEVIGGAVNVQEYENRVQLAADHVKKNADVLANLKEYYGVDTAGAMSYLLDPKVGMDVINKQVRASEIGAASDLYNFNLNQGEAESFINASGTADLNALKTEFGKARLLATTQARLSGIEGYDYKDTEAVASILGNDQMKLLESQKRASREVARYSGGSGLTASSLKTESAI